MSEASVKEAAIPDGLDGYLQVMAWWNGKDLTGKARVIGEDILDSWFEQVVRDEFLGDGTDG